MNCSLTISQSEFSVTGSNDPAKGHLAPNNEQVIGFDARQQVARAERRSEQGSATTKRNYWRNGLIRNEPPSNADVSGQLMLQLHDLERLLSHVISRAECRYVPDREHGVSKLPRT